MSGEVPLWADVPIEKRVTEEIALRCYNGHKILRRIERADAGIGCLAAVTVFERSDEWWKPCGMGCAEGADFCVPHGGPRKPPPAVKKVRYCTICGNVTRHKVYPCDSCERELAWFEQAFTSKVRVDA